MSIFLDMADNIFIKKITHPLIGDIKIAADKSISHRSLIFSALANGKNTITNLLESEDVINTAKALQKMGAIINKKDNGIYEVIGSGIAGLTESEDILDFGNSGTGARLLMGLVTPFNFKTFFTGDHSLRSRPMKRILLIDDIRTNIEMLAKDLRSKCSNFDITIMTDPVKAFELIKDNQIKGKNYDLILTDIEMPEMSGTELIAKVREELNIAKDNIPILAYSSRENQKIIDEAKNAGCNAYYTKPKDLRFIARNISKWTSNNYVPRKNTHHEEIIINENTLKDLNVIIADDQVMNLMLITRKFKSHGANVEKASDGEDIIKLMKDDLTKYHLIITDINMERINGIEAATEVRKMEKEYNLKHDKNINIPIIALSGDSHKEFVLKMLNNNIDDYMVKGSDPSDLIKLSKFWVDYRFDTHHNNIKQNIKKEQKAIITNGVLRRDFVQLFSNKAEAKEIIDIFEIESNIIFKLITDNKSDPVELTKEIHKIKGSSGSVGALKLSNYTAILNDIVKTGKLPEDDKFNLKIKEIIDETIKEMHIAIDDNFD
ncbi:response regulator [Rickettsiales bacterium]|nr:response regulator [Rickettsiales bacterium]